MLLRCLPLLAALASVAAMAVEDEWSQMLGRAQSIRDQATAIRAEADQRHVEAQTSCWQKVLVSACLDDAARARRADHDRARGLEHEAREIEKQVKRKELSERDARRREQAPAREAAAAAQAEKNRLDAEETRARVERRQAEAAQSGR
jgi:colicin import membrane protein